MVQDQLEIIKKEHPQWRVSEHPDFTSWMSSGWGNESPIRAEELRKIDIMEAISLLHSYKEDDILGPSRDGLLEQFTVAVKEDPGWGLRITRKLAESSEEAVDVWDRLFWALSDASLADRQWEELLTLIDNTEEFLEHDFTLARVLAQGMRKNENPLPYPLLPLAEKIASRLWEIAALKDNTSAALTGNWLTEAINHTGGVLAEFFLHAISSRKKHEEPRTEGIPIDLREQLDTVLEGENIASNMGRVVLASKLHFLFSIDPQWTTENMIPLFDWDSDELQAAQAWHGFLAWGRWFDDLLHHLLPLYKQCFNRLDSNLNDMRDRFTNHVANICIFSSLKETRIDWLNRFLTIVDNTSRKEFASAIGNSLWNMEDDRVEKIWKEWLFGYWENRLLGKPVPLDRGEMAEMVQWSPHLKPVFPSVVEIICRNEQELPIDDFVIRKLLEKKIPEAFPKETSRLLLYIASHSERQYFWELDEIIENLLHYNEAHSDLRETLDVLAEKGFQKAAEYRMRLEAMDEGS